jgi:hypothetical protein
MRKDARDDRRAAAAEKAHDFGSLDANQRPRKHTDERDRRPAGKPRSFKGSDKDRVQRAVDGRRPVPPSRPAPGASFGRKGTNSGAVAGSRRGPVKLSSRDQARTRATSKISHDNADRELERLVREIENDD